MGRGGGFSAANPLTRMLADKKAAAAARALLVDRVKRNSTSVTSEPSSGPRLRYPIPPQDPDLDPAGDAAAAEVSRRPLDDLINQHSALPALDDVCRERGQIGEVDTIAAPAATLPEDRLSQQALSSLLLVDMLQASEMFPPSEMSVLAQCLTGRTFEEYLEDREAMERRLRNIPPFLVPASSQDKVLHVLDRELASAVENATVLRAAPSIDEAGDALVGHLSEHQTSGVCLPSSPSETNEEETDRSSLHALPKARLDDAPIAAVCPNGVVGVEARDVALPTSAHLSFRRALPEPFDFERARNAVATLSKVGFDRARAYRDLADAYAVAARLGYEGPREGVSEFLVREIASRLGALDSGSDVGRTPQGPDSSCSQSKPVDDPPPHFTDDQGAAGFDVAAEQNVEPVGGSYETPDAPVGKKAETRATVVDILGWADPSVRLSNVARNNSLFGEWDIGDAVERREEFLSLVAKLGNVGAKTVAELSAILDDFLGGVIQPPTPAISDQEPESDQECFVDARFDRLVVDILDDFMLSVRGGRVREIEAIRTMSLRDYARDPGRFDDAVLAVGNMGQRTLENLTRILLEAVEMIRADLGREAGTSDAAEPAEEASPREDALTVISSLGGRAPEVLRSRFGLDGAPGRTLQEIAETMGITRERVRQIEAGALDRLRKAPFRKAVATFLAREQDAQWRVLSGPQSQVPFECLSERSNALDPLFALTAKVVFGELEKWLDKFVGRGSTGWMRTTAEVRTFDAGLRSLDRLCGVCPSPMPLASLRPELGDALDALRAVDYRDPSGWGIFEGYFFSEHFGSRVRRRIRLHVIASQIGAHGAFDIGTLVRAYRDGHPDDVVTSRVLLNEVDEAPHLFVCLFDSVWHVLPAVAGAAKLARPPTERAPLGDDDFEAGSASATIRDFLKRQPRRLSAITDMMARDTVSTSSAVPFLVSSPLFRRAAPGVYAISGHDERAWESPQVDMLSEADCRLFCFARHSGAPEGFYPAWGAGYEKALAEWAKSHAPTGLFRSLMSVVEPDKWPIAPEDDLVDRAAKQEGRWSIGYERKLPLGNRFIDPSRFLAVLAYLADFGSIGWCAVNRIAGAKLDQADAADVLAFLMLSGFVDPQDDWQGPHVATPLAEPTFLSASSHMHRRGRLEWDDAVLAPIMERLDEAHPVGWVPADEAVVAVRAWKGGQLGTGRAFEPSDDREPRDVEDTFATKSWAGLFGE